MPRRNKKRSPIKNPSESPPIFGSSFSSTFPDNNLMYLEQNLMIERSIAKRHGINLSPGTLNSARGNCAFEAAIFNVNDRSCFKEKFPFSHDYYRRIWVTDMKNRTLHDETWQIYSNKDWEAGWQEMKESGVYERGIFGDLMLFGISCGMKKVLLIFNTSLDSPHDPIYVIDPRKFGVEPDTQIPIVLAYNMSHYESVHPADKSDEKKV